MLFKIFGEDIVEWYSCNKEWWDDDLRLEWRHMCDGMNITITDGEYTEQYKYHDNIYEKISYDCPYL